jgi:hypothetical protein
MLSHFVALALADNGALPQNAPTNGSYADALRAQLVTLLLRLGLSGMSDRYQVAHEEQQRGLSQTYLIRASAARFPQRSAW